VKTSGQELRVDRALGLKDKRLVKFFAIAGDPDFWEYFDLVNITYPGNLPENPLVSII
jgi:hypothetical protein